MNSNPVHLRTSLYRPFRFTSTITLHLPCMYEGVDRWGGALPLPAPNIPSCPLSSSPFLGAARAKVSSPPPFFTQFFSPLPPPVPHLPPHLPPRFYRACPPPPPPLLMYTRIKFVNRAYVHLFHMIRSFCRFSYIKAFHKFSDETRYITLFTSIDSISRVFATDVIYRSIVTSL